MKTTLTLISRYDNLPFFSSTADWTFLGIHQYVISNISLIFAISRKGFFFMVWAEYPPRNHGNFKFDIVIFSNFFLGFMIEKIPYYWHFFGKNAKFFKYFWSTTYPIIHWYLAKFSENLRKFRFLGEILYQIKFAKIRSISWRISNLQIWQYCK